MRRAEFILAATLAFMLFCMAVIMGCMPGSWLELAAGGTAGGAEGRLTDVWIPLGTWLEIGGVRFKVVFEREPLTQLPVFTLIKPPSEIVSTAKLALGEKELRGPDVTVTIKDYKFLTARGMTWGGRILCDISVKRRFNPSMSVYSPELSALRNAWMALESVKTEEGVSVCRDLYVDFTVFEPALFSGPPTPTITVWGKGSNKLVNYVTVQLKVDWFPMISESVSAEDVARMLEISEADAKELLVKKTQIKDINIYPNSEFSTVFELPGWYTPEAVLHGRIAGEREWTELYRVDYRAKFGVDRPTKVELWKPLWENLGVQIRDICEAVNTLTDVFNKWTENVKVAYQNLVDEFNRQMERIHDQIIRFEQRVGEEMRKHENWTLEQLEAMRDWMMTSLTNITKPSLVIYAPQTAYAGVPNAFSIQPLNCVITDVRLEDATGVLWTGISQFFTATPRVPGSGLRLTVTYRGTIGEWAGKTFTKSVEIPFTYLTSISWENRQPVAAPPPEPLIKAWHLLVIGGVTFAVVMAVGLRRRG